MVLQVAASPAELLLIRAEVIAQGGRRVHSQHIGLQYRCSEATPYIDQGAQRVAAEVSGIRVAYNHQARQGAVVECPGRRRSEVFDQEIRGSRSSKSDLVSRYLKVGAHPLRRTVRLRYRQLHWPATFTELVGRPFPNDRHPAGPLRYVTIIEGVRGGRQAYRTNI